MKTKSIGIFDSGVGGLTVANHIIKTLPNENIVYFGDTARVPYGSRSEETILSYSIEDINFLKSKNVKLIVAACGTVSSIFFKKNISKLVDCDIPFLGIIEPTATLAASLSKNKNIGIIGTKSTINSNSYEACLKNLDPSIKTFSKACPLFVPIVEEGLFDHDIAYKTVDLYLHEFKNYDIDTLILGCTHYPLLASLINKYFENKVTLIDPGLAAAKVVKQYLIENQLQNHSGGEKYFYVSDSTQNFENIIDIFLGMNPEKNIEQVSLSEINNLNEDY